MGDTKLMDLATRCEQAAGQDRVLDCEIAVAVGWNIPGLTITFEQLIASCGIETVARNADNKGNLINLLPHYTASLDAAMTLVPGGWEPLLDGVGSEREMRWIVELYPEDGNDRIIHGAARQGPLALCAAALRAAINPEAGG